jgi:hypothetical protein
MKHLNHLKKSSEPLEIYILRMEVFVCNLREVDQKRASGFTSLSDESIASHPWEMVDNISY